MQFTIVGDFENSTSMSVWSEFNPAVRSVARQYAGKWNADESAWVWTDRAAVKNAIPAIWELFGAGTGELGREPETCIAAVPGNHPELRDDDGQLRIGGYVLATRRYRDSAVKLIDGVSLATGSFPGSGGSQKSPRVSCSAANVLHFECRREFAERYGLTIIENRVGTALADLESAKQRVIENIRALMAEHGINRDEI